jgi:threonine aldolase
MAADGRKPSEYGALFDSISICLSKGLGAPVGSVLIGKREIIKQGTRIRKVLGGAMRQAGYIAAAGIYALNNNIARLTDDHRNAAALAEALKECSLTEKTHYGGTNIVIFTLKAPATASDFLEKIREHGILALKTGERSIRMVTHLDVSNEQIREACEILATL